jgi:hypothetical protein
MNIFNNSYFNNFKTIANGGKTFNINNFLFLINDTNCELEQHFNNKYISNKTYLKTINAINYKNNVCNKLNIQYIFGIFPDKSFCLQNIIKDNNNNIKVNRYFVDILSKNINNCKFKFIDFYNVFKNLNNIENYFYKSDSHVNCLGSCLYINYLTLVII